MELDLPKVYLGSMCTAALIDWDSATSPPPCIWAHIRGRCWSAETDSIGISLWPPAFRSNIVFFSFLQMIFSYLIQLEIITGEWRYSQTCWYFRPSFLNCCPSNLPPGSTLQPPPRPPCVNNYSVYTYKVCNFLDDDILHCLLWVFSFYALDRWQKR
jgi:hypothetical protein